MSSSRSAARVVTMIASACEDDPLLEQPIGRGSEQRFDGDKSRCAGHRLRPPAMLFEQDVAEYDVRHAVGLQRVQRAGKCVVVRLPRTAADHLTQAEPIGLRREHLGPQPMRSAALHASRRTSSPSRRCRSRRGCDGGRRSCLCRRSTKSPPEASRARVRTRVARRFAPSAAGTGSRPPRRTSRRTRSRS